MSYANGNGYYIHNLVDESGENVTRLDMSKLQMEEIVAPDFTQVFKHFPIEICKFPSILC